MHAMVTCFYQTSDIPMGGQCSSFGRVCLFLVAGSDVMSPLIH